MKILHGEVFYRSIDAYPFPGSSYFLAFWMSLFGEHMTVVRVVAGLVFCGFCAGLYACALALLEPRRAALFALSLLSFKFLAFPNFTAYLYSDLALALAVAAVATFLRGWQSEGSRSLLITGALVSGVILCKQNLGIYLALVMAALILCPQIALQRTVPRLTLRVRRSAFLLFGIVGGLAPVLLYFASEGLLGAMLYSGLVRPFTGYLPSSGVPFSPLLQWWKFGALEGTAAQPYLPLRYTELLYRDLLPNALSRSAAWMIGELFSRLLYSSIPVVFGIWLFRWLRGLRRMFSRAAAPASGRAAEGLTRGRLYAFAGLSLAVTASAFPRADFAHIINIYPVFLLAWFALPQLSAEGRREAPIEAKAGGAPPGRKPLRLSPRLVGLEALAVIALLALVGEQARRYDGALTHRLELERASLRVRAEDVWVGAAVRFIENQVPRGAPLFVYGHEAYYYFLSDRYFPWPFVQLYPGMAGGDDGRALAERIISLRPRVVVKGIVRWPGMPDLTRYTPILAKTLRSRYRGTERWLQPSGNGAVVRPPRTSTFAMWELRPGADRVPR